MKTILFVDDDEAIIDAIPELLETMGYNVLTAKNGKEAIDIYSEHSPEIDLVLLDLIMPVMGGGETFDKLKEIDPEVKTILISGYNIDSQVAGIINRGCHGFIKKPFTVGELVGVISDGC